jgi:hypothetical protein
MTETEWNTCADPQLMLTFLRDRGASGRKLRLFAVACCRRIWDYLTDERSRNAIAVSEQFADGETTEEQLLDAQNAAWEADHTDVAILRHAGHRPHTAEDWATAASWHVADSGGFHAYDRCRVAFEVARLCAAAVDTAGGETRAFEYQRQCDLLRDVFGSPFRPLVFDHSWRTREVEAMARQMYESRDFSATPVFADALEDAGCQDEQLLEHCRGPGPHVRGCWVVDLVLGKT